MIIYKADVFVPWKMIITVTGKYCKQEVQIVLILIIKEETVTTNSQAILWRKKNIGMK